MLTEFDRGAGGAKEAFGGAQQFFHLGRSEPIEDLTTLRWAIDHQTTVAQARKMTRHVRLGCPHTLYQVRDPTLAVPKLEKNRDPRRVGESTEHLGGEIGSGHRRWTHALQGTRTSGSPDDGGSSRAQILRLSDDIISIS